jgi:hypothetical protein
VKTPERQKPVVRQVDQPHDLAAERTPRCAPTCRRFPGKALAATIACALAFAACSSGSKLLSSRELTTKIIPAPINFSVDSATTASGQMSPQLFTQYDGYEPAQKAGFVAGFTQAYSDPGTEEGLLVTVIEFHTPAEAAAYYQATSHRVLNAAKPTYQPMAKLTGATEAYGTRTYDGNYVHGASDSTGRFYFLLVYEDPNTAEYPTEFSLWADAQWELLQPGAALPSGYTSATTG